MSHEPDPEQRSNLTLRCGRCDAEFECIFPVQELDRLLDEDAVHLSGLLKDDIITEMDVQCSACQEVITGEIPADVMLNLLEARIRHRTILTALEKIERKE